MNKPETSDCRPTYVERLDRLIKPMTKTAEGLSDQQWEDYDVLLQICEVLDRQHKPLIDQIAEWETDQSPTSCGRDICPPDSDCRICR